MLHFSPIVNTDEVLKSGACCQKERIYIKGNYVKKWMLVVGSKEVGVSIGVCLPPLEGSTSVGLFQIGSFAKP